MIMSSVLIVPRRKTVLVEAHCGRAAMAGHGELAGEGKEGEGGEEQGARLVMEVEDWAPWSCMKRGFGPAIRCLVLLVVVGRKKEGKEREKRKGREKEKEKKKMGKN
jgi:hypothetical protein